MSDKAKIELLEEAAALADARRRESPKDANAHYLYAFALGRYSQGISVVKALAQGFGGKIKEALQTALKLDAKHADAHTAYGAYQAEVIDKVGGIVAGMTYGGRDEFDGNRLLHAIGALGAIHDAHAALADARRQAEMPI